MTRKLTIAILVGISGFAVVGVLRSDDAASVVQHAECSFFGADHDKYVNAATREALRQGVIQSRGMQHPAAYPASTLTDAVVAGLPPVPPGTRTGSIVDPATSSTIDRYIFQAIAAANVTPAPLTTDYEFVRRVTLDLTGRIPTASQVTNFVSDSSPDKRSKYIDSLLSSSQWVDKWTQYFGDFFQNNSTNAQGTRRFQDGVVAFNKYIRDSLSSGKPYDQLAREVITATGSNSYTQGELNYIVGGVVSGNPPGGADNWDQETVDIATNFLGISNLNCLLCHSGHGHLDSLNLWGAQTSREQAWGMASFMSHTPQPGRTIVNGNNNIYYWSVNDNPRMPDYPLNTTTGNRPARQPIGTLKNVPPQYLFTGQSPASGTNYRAAFAQYITSDFQFARAAVNYMWAQFFGMGIVDPPDQFDPARLDPDNPPDVPWPADPTQPWPLQPSNPQLLNGLAQDFIDSKYDLKALMREIANSKTYQLSSRYDGTWNPSWETLFARKMVRRLWSEEIHDAITQSSGMMPTYNMGAVFGTVNWAMQLPEPAGLNGTPDGNNGAINNFLNAFLRGNRDDQTRRQDGSISQALDLLNDPFVMNRVQLARATKTSLLANVQAMPAAQNDQAVNALFLSVLGRYPTSTEMSAAMGHIGNASTRNVELENLLWSLYNKVDFIFNY
ncbi:MAG TPA: DUF1553 domain-containing protein [Bryobacteraceae bacterium]|nr:DUF1553 domain-containing protein [Bryobacteraceae bacterium]